MAAPCATSTPFGDGLGAQFTRAMHAFATAAQKDAPYCHWPSHRFQHCYDRQYKCTAPPLGIGEERCGCSHDAAEATIASTLGGPEMEGAGNGQYASGRKRCAACRLGGRSPSTARDAGLLFSPHVRRQMRSNYERLVASGRFRVRAGHAPQWHAPGRTNVAVHIRRGDSPGSNGGRFVHVSVFEQMIAHLRVELAAAGEAAPLFHVFTEGVTADPDAFAGQPDVRPVTSIRSHPQHALVAFDGLVAGDALIMSPSFFSYAAALLSNSSRVYHLPMVGNGHHPLPHWKVWCAIKYSAVDYQRRRVAAAVPTNHADQYRTRPFVGWDLGELCRLSNAAPTNHSSSAAHTRRREDAPTAPRSSGAPQAAPRPTASGVAAGLPSSLAAAIADPCRAPATFRPSAKRVMRPAARRSKDGMR